MNKLYIVRDSHDGDFDYTVYEAESEDDLIKYLSEEMKVSETWFVSNFEVYEMEHININLK